jgi:hypothetical protein
MVTGITKHIIFRIQWIYILRSLYFIFSLLFFITFISKQILSVLFLTVMSGLLVIQNLHICLYTLIS